MAPLTIVGALLDAPEEQSPTLIIKGILNELAPKEEATEAQGDLEEECSNSTPVKKDVYDERAAVEGQKNQY